MTQIGSAPYAVTKHAAVAFAEWLSITYGDRGVGVSCLCPMGVNTAMTAGTDNGAAAASSTAAGDDARARGRRRRVVEGLRDERFLILPHPEVLEFFRRKGARLRPLAGRDAAATGARRRRLARPAGRARSAPRRSRARASGPRGCA